MNDIKYLSIKQIAENAKYPFTVPMMRHYLLNRHTNGLENAVYKIGKRLFLRSDLLDQWIESKRRGQ